MNIITAFACISHFIAPIISGGGDGERGAIGTQFAGDLSQRHSHGKAYAHESSRYVDLENEMNEVRINTNNIHLQLHTLRDERTMLRTQAFQRVLCMPFKCNSLRSSVHCAWARLQIYLITVKTGNVNRRAHDECICIRISYCRSGVFCVCFFFHRRFPFSIFVVVVYVCVRSSCIPHWQLITWIQADGENVLSKYIGIPLDDETVAKECENEFEKFYFVSMVSALPVHNNQANRPMLDVQALSKYLC